MRTLVIYSNLAEFKTHLLRATIFNPIATRGGARSLHRGAATSNLVLGFCR